MRFHGMPCHLLSAMQCLKGATYRCYVKRWYALLCCSIECYPAKTACPRELAVGISSGSSEIYKRVLVVFGCKFCRGFRVVEALPESYKR